MDAAVQDTETLSERRGHPRIGKYCPQGLALGWSGPCGEQRLFPAKLIDFSEGGLGVEMFVPLPVGTVIALTGELHGADFCVRLEGSARVAHCLYGRNGVFRVGLSFETLEKRPLDCEHEPSTRAAAYVLD